MARNPLSPFGSGSLSGGSDPFMTLHRDMNRLFDDVFRGISLDERGAASRGTVGTFIDTSLDVSETEKEFRITAELPGVNEQDIVRLEDDMSTIRVRRNSNDRKAARRRTSTLSNGPTALSSVHCDFLHLLIPNR